LWEVAIVAVILLSVLAILFLRPKGPKVGDVIYGKAYVTDGDGLRVAGFEVRIAGVDAPEWDQIAQYHSGRWFNHGTKVKIALIQEIGGKQVAVTVEGFDNFGRILGSVACRGKDIGEWLVENGYAIAAYSERYRRTEMDAKLARNGMWGYARFYDPRAWQHRDNSPN
jgi:endonuclease YncB( thermonuclease family)